MNTVTTYRNSKTKEWWAKDFTNWIADADQYGNFIKGKHKSDIGKIIKIKGVRTCH